MRPFHFRLVLALALLVPMNPPPLAAADQAPVWLPVTNPDPWLNWLIPLPKEIRIDRMVTLPADQVKITLGEGTGELGLQAERKLRDLFREKAGTEAERGMGFEIVLAVCDAAGRLGQISLPEATRLAKLPNQEQAYLIRPDGDHRLLLTALNPRGLFYAAATLRQLIEARFEGNNVSLPLAVVTDWPDLAERGQWGGSSLRDIEWLAERKMNLVEFHSTHEVDAQGEPVASISAALLRRGAANAVKMVPIISHLNGMGDRGVYRAWPELRGKGGKAHYKSGEEELWAPCASHPKLHGILAGWMRGYAACGVRDVSCWLGELDQHCQCEECSKTGQFALETRAFVTAWQLARQDCPGLRIRILTTQGSYSTNESVLAECPPGVDVSYYDGGRTYDSSRDPMIYPLLESFAAQGRWLGCYPQLTPSWRIVSPWSCPQFVRSRMIEFVDKKLSGLVGYVVPDNRLFDFNVTASAEWSWNAHGRDERQFAEAWATRLGLPQPQLVADWALRLGPVSWDLYGARLVERYLFHPATIERMAESGGLPAFGQGIFRYLPDEAALARNLDACRQAMHLAERAGSPAMKAETRVVSSYCEMLARLVQIGRLRRENKAPDAAGRQTLQAQLNAFALAAAWNGEALLDWERAAVPGAGSSRFLDGVHATEQTVAAVARALAPLGIRNPAPVVTNQKVGGWALEDFREQAQIEKTLDVTELITAPGIYRVEFHYTAGWNGAATLGAALREQPRDGSRPPKDVAVDEHSGVTGHRSKGSIYSLELRAHDPACRYELRVKFRGTRPQDQQPGRSGCAGEIRLLRERDLDWPCKILSVRPLDAP